MNNTVHKGVAARLADWMGSASTQAKIGIYGKDRDAIAGRDGLVEGKLNRWKKK